jgi:hypothetical protein
MTIETQAWCASSFSRAAYQSDVLPVLLLQCLALSMSHSVLTVIPTVMMYLAGACNMLCSHSCDSRVANHAILPGKIMPCEAPVQERQCASLHPHIL